MRNESDPSKDHVSSGDKATAQRSEQQQLILRKIARARIHLLVCFWTLPVYVIGLWLLLNSGRSIEYFMLVYMVVWAGFAIDMAMRRCPGCGKQFYVKTILLNLITQRCLHCGIWAKATQTSREF